MNKMILKIFILTDEIIFIYTGCGEKTEEKIIVQENHGARFWVRQSPVDRQNIAGINCVKE